jgi:predicted branched-subunit amino acid permease
LLLQEPDTGDDTGSPRDLGGLTPLEWAFEGLRQALTGPAFFVAIAMIGVGGLARGAGFPFGAAVASTFLIWAGPAQVLFFGAIAAGTALPAIALSICLSSIRLMPMCLSVLPMLHTQRTRLPTLLAASHFVAVTVWVESLRRLPDIPRDARLAFFFGFAATCITTTAAFTGGGYFLLTALPAPFAAGLLFLTPVYFLSTIVRSARVATDWFALLFGLALAPISQALIGGGFDLLALGLVGGTFAYFAGRALDRVAPAAHADREARSP